MLRVLLMKARFADGESLYISRSFPECLTYIGAQVRVIEAYVERQSEPRYYVATNTGRKFYAYESDLSRVDPIG